MISGHRDLKGFVMDATSYAFSAELNELNGRGIQCPPSGACAQYVTAWRWVADPITSQCFAPVAVRNPPRLLKEDAPAKICSCWGLSMHLSLDQSILAFTHVEKSFKMARKRLGGHIAQLSLTPIDGACSVADSYGHFDLHPYTTASLLARVVHVSPIP